MKMDQVAYYCRTLVAENAVKKFLGLEKAEWLCDCVKATSTFPTDGASLGSVPSTAMLQFNYDLGIELEILRYLTGPSWHGRNPLARCDPFQSHIGVHLDDGEAFPDESQFLLVQETFTLGHTAKYLIDPKSPGYGRKYHYRIYEVSPGSYIKYIRRIHP